MPITFHIAIWLLIVGLPTVMAINFVIIEVMKIKLRKKMKDLINNPPKVQSFEEFKANHRPSERAGQ